MNIIKIEIESGDSNCHTINCIIVNNKIIATSFDEGATLGMIDNIASNLSDAVGVEILSIDKKATYADLANDFNWEEMLAGIIDYCEDSILHDQAMPMDYEYCEAVFTLEEMILLIPEDKHTEFSEKILLSEA
jgi:hypothetical protein